MFIKQVKDYELMPRGYRLFRYDILRRHGVCAPIGLHILFKWGYRLWEMTFRYNLSYMEQMHARIDGLEQENSQLVQRQTRSAEIIESLESEVKRLNAECGFLRADIVNQEDAIELHYKSKLKLQAQASESLQQVWMDGFIAGLQEYAWWKDGVQYVGSCGTTLEKAIERGSRVTRCMNIRRREGKVDEPSGTQD